MMKTVPKEIPKGHPNKAIGNRKRLQEPGMKAEDRTVGRGYRTGEEDYSNGTSALRLLLIEEITAASNICLQ